MSESENCVPTNKRTPWNKGKLIGGDSAAPQARLVNQDSIAVTAHWESTRGTAPFRTHKN
jgi:hypothetical protein